MQTLRAGSTGEDVEYLQALLGIPVSGTFGTVTEDHVRTVQAAGKLKVDGVVGSKTWNYLLSRIKPIDYKQFDKRWAKLPFGRGGDTIKGSGCGITAAADLIAFCFDKSQTPVTVEAMADAKGYATPHSGTARAFFDWLPTRYHFSKYKRTTSTDEVVAALKQGAIVIALMGPDYWTKGGHYICCYKTDGKSIWACNPGSSYKDHSSIEIFRKQHKEYFIYWR